MDEDARDEIGRLHARLEYLRVAVSILLARLSKDEFQAYVEEIRQHFSEHRDAAVNSTFPDSYLRACENYPPEQIADAIQRRLRRPPRPEPKKR